MARRKGCSLRPSGPFEASSFASFFKGFAGVSLAFALAWAASFLETLSPALEGLLAASSGLDFAISMALAPSWACVLAGSAGPPWAFAAPPAGASAPAFALSAEGAALAASAKGAGAAAWASVPAFTGALSAPASFLSWSSGFMPSISQAPRSCSRARRRGGASARL